MGTAADRAPLRTWFKKFDIPSWFQGTIHFAKYTLPLVSLDDLTHISLEDTARGEK
jgi:hypothetical protein